MIVVGVGAASPILAVAKQGNDAGAVFVMTNAADKNEVIAFKRASNGTLEWSSEYETGGRGSGGVNDPLESQGSLTLSQDHSLLFAVNAGSGNISTFAVRGATLALINKTPSGGSEPVAVAENGGLVYVLNSGGAGSVVGFRLGFGGQLIQIENSTQFLSANDVAGASISFSPNGRFVLSPSV
jgi:6-phosphogluconolactonase (cycloisomerase 2 family)